MSEEEQQIRIQNFRCFKDLTVSGFKGVNLIGGKNNSGKTALLEALLLYFYADSDTAILLAKARKESYEFIRQQKKRAWNGLFYQGNLENKISLTGTFGPRPKEINIRKKIEVYTSEYDRSGLELANNFNNLKIQLADFLGEEAFSLSILRIKDYVGDPPFDSTSDLVAYSQGFFPPQSKDETILPFVSSFSHLSNEEIAQEHDLIEFEGRGEHILNLLQVIDPAIQGLRTYSHVEPTLYLKTKDNPRGLPISLFGEAIYRVTEMALALLNQDHNVLLIDEIENGIHHSSQKQIWEALFYLSETLDTKIFATTHSREMIEAFEEVGSREEFCDRAAYIELVRGPQPEDIIAISRDMNKLQYRLKRNKPVRGE